MTTAHGEWNGIGVPRSPDTAPRIAGFASNSHPIRAQMSGYKEGAPGA
ncbi:hypothetical protein ACFCW6_01865 [Streptomyces sp. NPDC056333]